MTEPITDILTPGPRPGTAAAAWANRSFRKIWIGSFSSNVGTWMQNVLLGPFCFKLAERTQGISPATFVGLITLAQLSPMLLSPVGGLIGDRFARRPYLVACQLQQLVFSLVLADLVAQHDPSKVALWFTVLALGFGNALNTPAWAAMLPSLVGRENLAGSVSLNSMALNGSRVIGPLIALFLVDVVGLTISVVFVINAATYLFIVYPLMTVNIGRAPRGVEADRLRDRLLAGYREARRIRLVGRIITVLALFSLLCLPFVGQFSAVAEKGFHLNSRSPLFRFFYAVWGLGSAMGGLSTATLFAHRDNRRTARGFLVGFALAMAAFAIAPKVLPGLDRTFASQHYASFVDVWPAFLIAIALGFCYFATTTSMLTVLQQHVGEHVRARVMALWFMAFGGMIPVGALWGGVVIDATSPTVMLLIGSAGALGLAYFANFHRLSLEAHRLGQVD